MGHRVSSIGYNPTQYYNAWNTGSYGSSGYGYGSNGGGDPNAGGGSAGSTVESKSNLFSASAFMGYAGLLVDKNVELLRFTAKQAESLADIRDALRATKVAVISGKALGVVGTLIGSLEDAKDANGFTWGDGVKAGVGIVATFTPYGWAYAVVNLATGIITETTLTDHIGNAIDGK